MKVRISAPAVARGLLALVILLQLASAAGQLARHGFGHGRLLGFVPAFHVDAEANVPAWYSSMSLLLCALLLGLIALGERARGGRRAAHWAGLGLVFAFLSVDEASSLHELLVEPLRGALGAGGPLYFAWVVAGAGFVLLLGTIYARFLLELPPPTRNRFLVAAGLFLGGALGMECLSGAHVARHGFETATFAVMTAIEETLEMLGVVVFAHALLLHLAATVRSVRIEFRADAPEGVAMAGGAEAARRSP